MPPQKPQPAPDFIAAEPDFIPAEDNAVAPPGVPAAPQPKMEKVFNPGPALEQVGNVLTGAGKGLVHTISGTDEWARQHLPAFLTNSNMGFGPPADLEHVKQMATPEGTAQKIGYGGEQVGEFMLPGGAEEKGAAKLAEFAPKLGKLAKPLARVLTSGVSSGAVNAAQGGSPLTGALMGAGGQIVGQGLKAMAPTIAEGALNIRKLDRAYGKGGGNIGRAILDETRGIRPGTVADSAEERLGKLNPQLNAAADQASLPTSPMAQVLGTPNIADLRGSKSVLANATNQAARQGERTTMAQLEPMATHLTEDISGQPIPSDVTPRQLLDLKRGFGNEFIHRWNPDTMTGVKGTAAKTYHAMANEFNNAVPGAQDLNSRISNLIPVAKRASSAELNAPTVQRAVNRFAAHTGALTGAGIGGTLGYKEGGIPGAVAGGLTGVLAPELIASPEGQLALARTLYKVNGLRPIVASGLQMDRKRSGE